MLAFAAATPKRRRGTTAIAGRRESGGSIVVSAVGTDCSEEVPRSWNDRVL